MKIETKTCGHCKKEQSFSEFYKKKSGKQAGEYESWCKTCKNEKGRVIDRIRYRLECPKRYKLTDWKRQLKQIFTHGMYDRLFFEQKGCCAVCGKHQSELKKALGVDHNHVTGQIRGLLCSACNFLIGHLEKGEVGRGMEYLKIWNSQEDGLLG